MTQASAGKRSAPNALIFTLAALLWMILSAAGVAAQEDEYTVSRIPMDVTADNAVQARDRALLRAQREGLNRLAERFGVKPPQVSDARATDYVISIEIASEKSSAVRYVADVTVHYNPIAVNRLLNRSASATAEAPPASTSPAPESPIADAPPVAEAAATPGGDPAARPPPTPPPAPVPANAILVVPVYEWSGARSLWDASNPWYLAWKSAQTRIGGQPTVVPRGEAADLEALTAEQAVARDRSAIAALARTYKLADTLVAHAVYEIDYKTGRPIFRVAVTGYGDHLGGLAFVARVSGEPTEFVDELAKRAVAEVAAEAERNRNRGGSSHLAAAPERPAPQTASLPDGPQRDVLASVALRGPADLGRVRQQIARTQFVVRDELVSLSRDSATLRLFYRGSAEQLRTALAAGGIVVAEEAGQGWNLRPSGGAYAPGTIPVPR